MTARDITSRARITDVWTALGGPLLRHGRGQAWWREGDGLNVSVNDSKGTWFDHGRGDGGGILDLIVIVRSCSRAEALAWLGDYLGISLDTSTPEQRRQWQREREDRRAAELWARSAAALAESLLESDSLHDRAALTRIMMITRAGGSGLTNEYRAWRSAAPELTKAMVNAGHSSEKRLHHGLTALIAEWGTVHVAA